MADSGCFVIKNRVLWARIFYFKTPLDNNTGFNNYILYGFLFDIQDTLSYIIFNNNSLSFASPSTRENTQSDDPVSHQVVVRVYD